MNGRGISILLITVSLCLPALAGGKMSPDQLGQAIGDVYLKALQDATALVKDKPDAAKVKPQLSQLKEATILKLVELGKQRQALSQGERGTVDGKVSMVMGTVSSDLFTKYGEATNHYIGKDEGNATHMLLSSFNTITQYANFDLLKQQEPAEAKRLGIQ